MPYIRTIDKFNFSVVLFSILVVVSGTSFASEGFIKLKPKISVKETYNDNIDFTTRDELSDFLTTYTPSITISRDTEGSRIEMGASAQIEDYMEEDHLDNVSQYYNLGFDGNLSSFFTLNLDGSYIQDTTLENELIETGLIYAQSERETFRLGPGFTWRLSNIDSISFNSGYTDRLYETEIYTDYRNYDYVLSWSHVLSLEGTSLSVSTGYNNTDYDTSKLETLSLYSGLNLPLDPKWELNFWAGIRYTISEYDNLVLRLDPSTLTFYLDNEEKTESNWGGIGNLSIKRHFERGSISGELSRDIVPTGRGELVVRDRARVILVYRLTDLLTGNLRGAWTESKSESSYRDTDEAFYSFTSSLRYRVWKNVNAGLSFTHSERENRRSDNEAYKNLVFVQITAFWDKL